MREKYLLRIGPKTFDGSSEDSRMMLGTLGHHDGWTGEDPADDADGMPGMGAPAALAGLGGVGYLLARQRGSEPTSDR